MLLVLLTCLRECARVAGVLVGVLDGEEDLTLPLALSGFLKGTRLFVPELPLKLDLLPVALAAFLTEEECLGP